MAPILGITFIGLFLFLFFISYIIKVTLEKNDVGAYSFISLFWLLNIGRLKYIFDKDSSAKFLYYLAVTALLLLGLIILYFIVLIILS